MDETKEQQSIHNFLRLSIYLYLLFDILIFVYFQDVKFRSKIAHYGFSQVIQRTQRIIFFENPLNSRLFLLILIAMVSVGTLSRKEKDVQMKTAVLIPITVGLFLFFFSLYLFDGISKNKNYNILGTNWYGTGYIATFFIGTLLTHTALENISKFFSSKLGKDKWNVEGESFMQPMHPKNTPYAINIPMLFYYRNKVRKGYIVIENPFRGTLLVGTPGSGKSFGIVIPVIRQMIAREYTLLLYDFKFPDLGKVAYYHYLLAKQKGKCQDHNFHVINLAEPERSRRINPWKPEYLQTLAEASETAEAVVEALKKGDKSSGSEQFFTQSAVNFLASCIYFLAKYKDGRYSSLPHVLAFLNRSYEEIFKVLFTNKELESLLSPFMTAYKSRATNQLEGQLGTLKIFLSRLATKETFWIFSGNDFDLKISDPLNPSILILANDPNTQNINSTCYSVIVNRITRLINTRGNKPVGLIIDEAPTLYAHKVENLISLARSNLVAVLLGLQELPQFQQQYGKETAKTITSIVGNVLSGAVRNKETLEWLERIFGKVKQLNESLSIDRQKTSFSLSERLEPLVPAGKIAALKAGEMVGILAADAVEKYTGKFVTSVINCRVNIDINAVQAEEKQYRDLPIYYNFGKEKENILLSNYLRIRNEINDLVGNFEIPANTIPVSGNNLPQNNN